MNAIRWTAVAAVAAFAGLAALGGCKREADVASYNLSYDADNFKIMRRIVFYNGITGGYILEVTGLCSIGNESTPGELSITCKTGEGQFIKHFLGRSDNVTYFAEQVEAADVSTYHYSVRFAPQQILPDIDFAGDAQQLTTPAGTTGSD